MCCRCCICCPLKWRAGALFSFPLFYASVLVALISSLPSPFTATPILSLTCLSFAAINLLTFSVGELGIFCRLEAALRATLVLLIMENVVTLFISFFFLVFSLYKAFHPASYRRWPLVSLSPAAAVSLSLSLFLLSLLSMSSLCVVAEYQADLDAEAFIAETERLRYTERQALLDGNRGPPKYTPEEGSLKGGGPFEGKPTDEEPQVTGAPSPRDRKETEEKGDAKGDEGGGPSVSIAMPEDAKP